MDEPFSHLDAITARKLREELQGYGRRRRPTVLFVTHDVLEAVQLSTGSSCAYGGKNFADLPIDSYPRLQTDPAVATMQAQILEVFEEMDVAGSSSTPGTHSPSRRRIDRRDRDLTTGPNTRRNPVETHRTLHVARHH